MGCTNAKAAQSEKASRPEATRTEDEHPSTEDENRAATSKAVDEAKQPVEIKQPVESRLSEDTPRLLPGETVIVAKEGGIEGTVVQCTTTDVQLRTCDGEQWFDIEDVLHFDNHPPLANELKEGTVVTTVGGLSGTVVKRTTTEVCLRTEDGEERWCGIEDVLVVRITIVSAEALRNADWFGKSDPYVVCQIDGRPTTIKTPTVADNLAPVWNFEANLLGFQKGDTLKFNIWDSDTLKKDDFLGSSTLNSDQFFEKHFHGQLPLEGPGANGHLTVTVQPVHVPKEENVAAAPQRDEPELTDEVQKPKGCWWGC